MTDGNEVPSPMLNTIPFSDPAREIVTVKTMFDEIAGHASSLGFTKEFTSAQFSLQMIEGVQKVRFVRN